MLKIKEMVTWLKTYIYHVDTLIERAWTFCKILYVTKHFLNDIGWFISNIQCLNFVCWCNIFQVFPMNLIKLGGIL